MHKTAQVYEQVFQIPLKARIAELLQRYPDVIAPHWISWEGARYTNVQTSAGLRRWLDALEAQS